ncbi:MAG: TetR/AcrR family transcriptional regulator [Streptosporangiaceae bacterium]
MPKIAEEARAARRDQIVAAAAECFARSGYHVTTMADIAEAAGVSKGTPYLYFPSKEALFIALYEEWDCGLAAGVNAAVSALPEPARSPRAVLAAVASAIAAHVLDNPQTCRVLMEATTLAAYEPAIAAKVRAANAGNLDQLTGLFEAGVAAGEWPPGTDPALRARLFTAGLYGLMTQWHLAPGAFNLEAAMETLAEPLGLGDHDAGRHTEGAGT